MKRLMSSKNNKKDRNQVLLNYKLILITFLIILIFLISLLNITIAQETSQQQIFDINKVDTWTPEKWIEIKQSSEIANSAWEKATPADRNKFLDNLINQNKADKIKINLGSSELKFEKSEDQTRITNGRTFIDPEKLPSNLQELSYDDSKDAFVYKFKEQEGTKIKEYTMGIRDGTLTEIDRELTITGTKWPSDGLRWNKKGSFSQTEKGVELTRDSKVKVGILDVGVNDKSKKAFVEFFPGELGNKYLRGENLDVAIVGDFDKFTTMKVTEPDGKISYFPPGTILESYLDELVSKGARVETEVHYFSTDPKSDFFLSDKNFDLRRKDAIVETLKDFKIAEVKTPAGKTTEILIGDVPFNVLKGEGQYVQFTGAETEFKDRALNGINIRGNDIEAEMFTNLEKIDVNGENILIKNNEQFYQFKNDKNGKPQTYTNHKPGEGYDVKIINNGIELNRGDVEVRNEPIEVIKPFEPGKELVIAPQVLPERQPTTQPTEITPPSQPQPTTTPTTTPPTEERTTVTTEDKRLTYDFTKARTIRKIISRTETGTETSAATFYVPEEHLKNFRNIGDDVPRLAVAEPILDLPDDYFTHTTAAFWGNDAAQAGIDRYSELQRFYGYNVPANGQYITTYDLKKDRDENLAKFGFNQNERDTYIRINDGIFSDIKSKTGRQYFEPGYQVRAYSYGKGSGKAQIGIYDPYNKEVIKPQNFEGNDAEVVIKYINENYRRNYLRQ
ncbi:MAG: hypothetical protein AABW90_00165 [Nanoarchaeota archaeon]